MSDDRQRAARLEAKLDLAKEAMPLNPNMRDAPRGPTETSTHAVPGTHRPSVRATQAPRQDASAARRPPSHGLSPLSPDEVVGLRRRFVLAPDERPTWGRVFRQYRSRGLETAIERADAAILCARGRSHDVPLRLRQLDLFGRVP